MTDATLVLKVDSSEVAKGKVSLDTLAASGETAEKATSKLTTATGTLVTAIRQAAGAFGLYKLAGLISEMATLNARFETMSVVMSGVGRNAGYSANEMTGFEMALRKTGISMIEARENITKMAQAQLDLTKSSELARVAQDAAVIGGINSSEAFARMVHGIQAGQTETLRTIGINVNFEQSYDKLAKTLGTTAKNLDETQKAQARMNAVIEYGTRIAGTYEAAMGTAGKQMSSMKRYVEDLKVKLGETFNEALTIAVFGFSDALKDAGTEADKLAKDGSLREWGRDSIGVLAYMADGLMAVAGAIMRTSSTIVVGIAQLGALAKGDVKGAAAMGEAWLADMNKYIASLSSFSTAAATFYAGKDAARQSDLNREKNYLTDVANLRKEYAGTSLATQQAAMKMLADTYYPETVKGPKPTSTRSVDATGDAAAKAAKAKYDSAIKSSQDFIAQIQKETDTLGMTTAQQSLYNAEQIARTLKLAGVREKNIIAFLTASAKEIAANEKAKASIDARVSAEKNLADQTDRLNESLNEKALAESDSIKSAEDLIKSYTEETALLGLTNEQREVAIALRTLEAEKTNLTTEALDKYKIQLREVVGANQASKQALADADAVIAEQADVWKSIDRTAHDTFISILDGGKDFAKRLKDTLKNVLFDWLYQMTVKKWLINLSASVSGAGVAEQAFGAAGGAGSAVSGFSTGASALGAAGNVASFADSAGLLGSAAAGGVPVTSTIGAVASGAGYVGAGSTGLIGTAGAALAAIPVWGWVALAALAIYGLSGSKPSNKSGWAMADMASGELLSTGGQTGDKYSQENRDAAKAGAETAAAYAQMLQSLGGTVSGTVRVGAGSRDGWGADLNGDGKNDFVEKDTKVFFDRLFDALTESAVGLDDVLKTLLVSFDGTTEEAIKFAGALVAVQDYMSGDLMTDALGQIEQAGRSTWQIWADGNAELRNLAASFDGSLSSATALADASANMYQMELSLVGQIQGLLLSTSAMFGNSIEQIKLSVMDQSQQYDYWRTATDTAYAALMVATDPAEIARLSGQVNTGTNTAYGLLDDAGKAAHSQEFIAYFESAGALTAERLNTAQTTVIDSHQAIADVIKTAITDAAAIMLVAAQTQLAAAQTPVVVDVNVNSDNINTEVGLYSPGG